MGMIVEQQNLPVIRQKYKDKIIVAANGCFDIFHIGHLEYLSIAKKLGDVLFVGINSDGSVLENKGKFSIFNSMQRILIINALKCVDYVFLFNEKTFSHSLSLLKPHIFARGADVGEKSFPESEMVALNHIEVVKAGDNKISSSKELRKYFE